MSLKNWIKGITSKKRSQPSEYKINRTLTDNERSQAHQKLANVLSDISDYEEQNHIKVLSSARLIEAEYYNEDSVNDNRIDFFSVRRTKYTLPLAIFMAIPQKRIVLGVTRALMIGNELYK